MAKRLQSLWMTLLLVSVTMMLLQPQEVEGTGRWWWKWLCCLHRAEEPQPTEVIDLKKEVMTKCQEFLGNDNTDRCNEFWDRFTGAFVNKAPQTVTPEAYNDLIKEHPIPKEKDKVLLWSKTKHMVTFLSKLTEKHFFHIGDTIFGIMDEAVWCGKNNNKDVLTSGCPEYMDGVEPVGSYWKRVSQAFAEAAEGTVTVLLSGAVDTPFDTNSIFAVDELPKLDPKKVTLRVILINTESQRKTCDDKSLKDLEKKWGHPEKYHCRHTLESDLKIRPPATW
ncbi:ADP-ribosyl cyclase/cyclic ADP-ribose hydrolase 1-like [Dicentrarchus labrax]|uniref:ADP-ribosyl cyclase/cyclic ADP-ribose hydrolase 1-like n=1 Tax=Dicentrarchus labrax TaxID=13489 RepID=UPI0021F5D165|nr:ADP-ribosyl cyclase/cyclic ADP-ribose hydrolase 1-like [Dicentrarchus labrax]